MGRQGVFYKVSGEADFVKIYIFRVQIVSFKNQNRYPYLYRR